MSHEGGVCPSAQELCLDSQPPRLSRKGVFSKLCVHCSSLCTESLSSKDSVRQILGISHIFSSLLGSHWSCLKGYNLIGLNLISAHCNVFFND